MTAKSAEEEDVSIGAENVETKYCTVSVMPLFF